jgi:hypothetical protein
MRVILNIAPSLLSIVLHAATSILWFDYTFAAIRGKDGNARAISRGRDAQSWIGSVVHHRKS